MRQFAVQNLLDVCQCAFTWERIVCGVLWCLGLSLSCLSMPINSSFTFLETSKSCTSVCLACVSVLLLKHLLCVGFCEVWWFVCSVYPFIMHSLKNEKSYTLVCTWRISVSFNWGADKRYHFVVVGVYHPLGYSCTSFCVYLAYVSMLFTQATKHCKIL